MRGKDPRCPNCGGRSFSPVDPSDYYECELCERPSERFHRWYRDRHPEAYGAFMELRPELRLVEAAEQPCGPDDISLRCFWRDFRLGWSALLRPLRRLAR